MNWLELFLMRNKADVIYVNLTELIYKSREYVLGCCTRLENGVVLDQANKFFYQYRYNKGCGYISLLVKNSEDVQSIVSSPWYFRKKCVPPFPCTIGVGYVFY